MVDVVFFQSTCFEVAVDLDGKRLCSDHISSAHCYSSSPWLEELTKTHPYDSFEGYLHFRIYFDSFGRTHKRFSQRLCASAVQVSCPRSFNRTTDQHPSYLPP